MYCYFFNKRKDAKLLLSASNPTVYLRLLKFNLPYSLQSQPRNHFNISFCWLHGRNHRSCEQWRKATNWIWDLSSMRYEMLIKYVTQLRRDETSAALTYACPNFQLIKFYDFIGINRFFSLSWCCYVWHKCQTHFYA